MRARQVRHLVRRPIRLFSDRSGDGPFATFAARARRERRSHLFFSTRKKNVRFDSRAEKPSRGAAAFAGAEGRAP